MSNSNEDIGRPVRPHRSGGGNRVGFGWSASLAVAAALALGLNAYPVVRARRVPDWPFEQRQPDNRGRRAEKDAAALAKAEAKRQRKAAKRAGEATK